MRVDATRGAVEAQRMRVDLDGPSDLVFLMQKYRTCPTCCSGRVTVQDTSSSAGENVLAVRCADCAFALDAPKRTYKRASPG
jgi:hypothetical protein